MLQNKRILRFVLVGVANATISFGVLNICFYRFGQSKVVSSVVATACAVLFSFALNRMFVFADKSRRAHQQFLPFVIVTISGSLIVINLVYVMMLHVLSGREALPLQIIKDGIGLKLSKSFIDINLSTVAGAVVAMVWNYNGYKWFVFRRSDSYGVQEAEITG